MGTVKTGAVNMGTVKTGRVTMGTVRMRAVLATVLTVVLLALAGCAGLPTSGEVQRGRDAVDDPGPDILLQPDRPIDGATPQQIVEGFIRAGSGPADEWERAGLFLSPEFRRTWKPDAGVTVDVQGDRTYGSAVEGSVSLSLSAVATVDASGAYSLEEVGPTTLDFELAQQDDGEWRITRAPDGIVLDQGLFRQVYGDYPLMYFDPTWSFLVPDVRWFPRVNAASRVTNALVNGTRSGWLADAVTTAFPEGVTASPSVVVAAGVAQVQLEGEVLALDGDTLDRMITQLQASLSSAGVTTVEMSENATSVSADVLSTRSTTVDASPLVVLDRLGFLTGDELTPVAGLTEAMTTVVPVAVELSPDRDFAAVLTAEGSVVRVIAEGVVEPVDDRTGLVDPTVDTRGYVWSVPEAQPDELWATAEGEEPVVLAGLGGVGPVSALSMSRDGSRLAALVTSAGRAAVWIFGVVRDPDGVPTGLSQPLLLGQPEGTGLALSWLDDVTLGILTRDGDDAAMTEQPVGGPAGTPITAPPDATQIAGANRTTTVRIKSADGTLYARRGSNWSLVTGDVLVLATQQGSPR